MTRVRIALEGSRSITLGGGRLSLMLRVEVGLRRDGGAAETGAGMDVVVGLSFIDAVSGLSLDVRVRTLVVHQADEFSARGMSLWFWVGTGRRRVRWALRRGCLVLAAAVPGDDVVDVRIAAGRTARAGAR